MKKTKIGFLPLYLKLYDDVDPSLRNAFSGFVRTMEDTLKSRASVVNPGIVATKTGARTMEDLFRKENVSAVFTLHLAYSQSYLVSEALARLNLPVFMLDATKDSGFQKMKPDFLMNNHGIHGVMDLASVLHAKGVAYNVIAGQVNDSSFLKKVGSAVDSTRLAAGFMGQIVGLTGQPFEMMGDFEVPFKRLSKMFGVNVVRISDRLLLDLSGKIKRAAVSKVVAEDRKRFAMGHTRQSDHEDSVRVYLALKQLATTNRLSAYTMNFLDTRKIAAPFYAANRLMEDGLGYAGEGDVLTALLAKPLREISKNVTFSEFFCPDWKRGLILMSHMGEINPAFACRGEKGSLRPKKAFGGEKNSLYHRFTVKPGKATFVNISKTAAGFKLVTGAGEIVKAPLYECLDTPQFVFRPRLELPDFLEQYSLAGGGHHIYLAESDVVSDVLNLGTAMNMQVLKI